VRLGFRGRAEGLGPPSANTRGAVVADLVTHRHWRPVLPFGRAIIAEAQRVAGHKVLAQQSGIGSQSVDEVKPLAKGEQI
jgi:hypothetical protein